MGIEMQDAEAGVAFRVRADRAERHGMIAAEDDGHLVLVEKVDGLVINPVVHLLADPVHLLRRGARFPIEGAALLDDRRRDRFRLAIPGDDFAGNVEHGDSRLVRAAGLVIVKIDLARRFEYRLRSP